jgi:hypothetical protein
MYVCIITIIPPLMPPLCPGPDFMHCWRFSSHRLWPRLKGLALALRKVVEFGPPAPASVPVPSRERPSQILLPNTPQVARSHDPFQLDTILSQALKVAKPTLNSIFLSNWLLCLLVIESRRSKLPRPASQRKFPSNSTSANTLFRA